MEILFLGQTSKQIIAMKNQHSNSNSKVFELKKDLWIKTIGGIYNVNYKVPYYQCEEIAKIIDLTIGDFINEDRDKMVLHRDTIYNFFNKKTESYTPSKKTLDRIAWFVLGGGETTRTFLDYSSNKNFNSSVPEVDYSDSNSLKDSKKINTKTIALILKLIRNKI